MLTNEYCYEVCPSPDSSRYPFAAFFKQRKIIAYSRTRAPKERTGEAIATNKKHRVVGHLWQIIRELLRQFALLGSWLNFYK